MSPGWKTWIKAAPGAGDLHARIKAAQQEHRAAREAAFYSRRAAALGLVPPRLEELPAAVQARLRTRGGPIGSQGGLHIFLAYALYNWEAALPEALAAFGKVTAFEWRSLGFQERAPGWLARRAEMNAALLEAFEAAHRARPVNVVVGYLSGWNASPDAVRRLGRHGAAVLNFCWDDKLHYRGVDAAGWPSGPAALAAEVDLNLTNAPDSVRKYLVDGGLAAFWPEAASPAVHRPFEVPFEFDVSFVGTCYGWRPRLVRALERGGVRVEAFGRGWPNGPLPDAEMVRIYSRSRINLGFGGVGFSRRLLCLKGRDFEVPMAGGLYLTQHNPELEKVFRIGEEILTYSGADDCLAAVRTLLADPARCARIRAAGRARALAEHTWERRFEQALWMAGLLGVQDGAGAGVP